MRLDFERFIPMIVIGVILIIVVSHLAFVKKKLERIVSFMLFPVALYQGVMAETFIMYIDTFTTDMMRKGAIAMAIIFALNSLESMIILVNQLRK